MSFVLWPVARRTVYAQERDDASGPRVASPDGLDDACSVAVEISVDNFDFDSILLRRSPFALRVFICLRDLLFGTTFALLAINGQKPAFIQEKSQK